MMNLKNRTVPVFIYPSELIFYVGSQSTHKQLLTLYNPYDFPVKYQVFANTTDRYGVVDPKGSIAPKSSVDLLIRHYAPIQANCHSRDKFMITMQDATTNELLGKRCITATLLSGENDDGNISSESAHSYTPIESSTFNVRAKNKETDPSIRNYLIVLSIVFTLALIMPTKCDDSAISSIPSYLHIGVAVKIIIGYVLGIITMALLKPC